MPLGVSKSLPWGHPRPNGSHDFWTGGVVQKCLSHDSRAESFRGLVLRESQVHLEEVGGQADVGLGLADPPVRHGSTLPEFLVGSRPVDGFELGKRWMPLRGASPHEVCACCADRRQGDAVRVDELAPQVSGRDLALLGQPPVAHGIAHRSPESGCERALLFGDFVPAALAKKGTVGALDGAQGEQVGAAVRDA